MKLDELDAKIVPQAAARVRAAADRWAARRARLQRATADVDAGSLRALDARFARSGPLALLRDVPQVGFVMIAAVFLAGAGTAVSRESARNRAAQQQTVDTPPAGSTDLPMAGDSALGPDVGETSADYEKAAATDLTRAATGSPDSSRVALISFSDYRTPAQAKMMLEGFTVRRVFLRAKAGGKDAAQLPVDIKGELVGDLRTAYATTARGRLEAQKSYQGYVDSLTVTTKEEQAFKDLYAAFARSTGIEARAYRNGCACVYAAVVEAKAGRLVDLRSRPGVRAVEVAGQGMQLRQLQVLPLLPEVKGVVPKQQAQP